MSAVAAAAASAEAAAAATTAAATATTAPAPPFCPPARRKRPKGRKGGQEGNQKKERRRKHRLSPAETINKEETDSESGVGVQARVRGFLHNRRCGKEGQSGRGWGERRGSAAGSPQQGAQSSPGREFLAKVKETLAHSPLSFLHRLIRRERGLKLGPVLPRWQFLTQVFATFVTILRRTDSDVRHNPEGGPGRRLKPGGRRAGILAEFGPCNFGEIRAIFPAKFNFSFKIRAHRLDNKLPGFISPPPGLQIRLALEQSPFDPIDRQTNRETHKQTPRSPGLLSFFAQSGLYWFKFSYHVYPKETNSRESDRSPHIDTYS